jgi:phospholipid/cholesterol/gamma-HCH transport system substrate-binding protein
MKRETKLGIFVFIAIILFAVGVIWKSSLLLKVQGYAIYGSFQAVNGLLPGAEVRYRGFLVGTVSDMVPDPSKIMVKLFIKRGINISEGSTLRVDFDGLIGEKYINIVPNPNSNLHIRSGSVLMGHSASSLVDFVHVGTASLEETKQILEVFRKIFTQEETGQMIQQFMYNMTSITNRLDSILESVDVFLEKKTLNKWNNSVANILSSLENLVNNLNLLLGHSDALITDDNLKKIVNNFESFSSALTNVTNKVDNSTQFLSETSLGLDASFFDSNKYEIVGSMKASKDVLALGFGKTGSINGVNLTHLTYGKRLSDSLLASIGFIEAGPGVKVKNKITNNIYLEHSLYNLNKWFYRLKTSLFFTPNLRGIVGYDYSSNENNLFLGVGFSSD